MAAQLAPSHSSEVGGSDLGSGLPKSSLNVLLVHAGLIED